ncbi:MAG TPA: hypothetical protein VM260_04060, partial [Pirellula sp.]|nr:hypothetical protein [Pirellula sp.]
MKRFVYAAAAVALTGVLVLLAMAVAQRDARVSDTSAIENDLPYANQLAQPISGNNIDGMGQEYSDVNNWPPVPIVRGNDSPPSTRATLTAYSGENSTLPSRSDIQGNIRNSTFDGQLAEPPSLDGNAINPFINNTSNPSLPSTPNTLPSMPIAPSAFPSTPNTLPSMASSPSAYPEPQSIGKDLQPDRLPSSPLENGNLLPLEPSFSHNDLPTTLPSPGQSLPPLPGNVTSPIEQTSPATAGSKSIGFSSAAPGIRQLDGSQNPSMEIQKRAPSEVQVGIPATFSVLVRNVGNATAFDVNVVDAVPKGARLLRTSPQAQPNGPNGLNWKLGEMAAGSEQLITMELVPESEGEIGSVASVNFAAQASVRTMSTQPKLAVKQLFEPLVLGGESVIVLIEVSNTGTGTARDVRLEEDVPQNM